MLEPQRNGSRLWVFRRVCPVLCAASGLARLILGRVGVLCRVCGHLRGSEARAFCCSLTLVPTCCLWARCLPRLALPGVRGQRCLLRLAFAVLPTSSGVCGQILCNTGFQCLSQLLPSPFLPPLGFLWAGLPAPLSKQNCTDGEREREKEIPTERCGLRSEGRGVTARDKVFLRILHALAEAAPAPTGSESEDPGVGAGHKQDRILQLTGRPQRAGDEPGRPQIPTIRGTRAGQESRGRAGKTSKPNRQSFKSWPRAPGANRKDATTRAKRAGHTHRG